jgi:hypothetical protein
MRRICPSRISPCTSWLLRSFCDACCLDWKPPLSVMTLSSRMSRPCSSIWDILYRYANALWAHVPMRQYCHACLARHGLHMCAGVLTCQSTGYVLRVCLNFLFPLSRLSGRRVSQALNMSTACTHMCMFALACRLRLNLLYASCISQFCRVCRLCGRLYTCACLSSAA